MDETFEIFAEGDKDTEIGNSSNSAFDGSADGILSEDILLTILPSGFFANNELLFIAIEGNDFDFNVFANDGLEFF